jgi:hypothetical protein
MYNETAVGAARNIFELFSAMNETSNDMLVAVLMLITFVIIYVMFSNYPNKIVILVDSILMTIVGILFFMAGMVGWAILFAPIIILFISILMVLFLPES